MNDLNRERAPSPLAKRVTKERFQKELQSSGLSPDTSRFERSPIPVRYCWPRFEIEIDGQTLFDLAPQITDSSTVRDWLPMLHACIPHDGSGFPSRIPDLRDPGVMTGIIDALEVMRARGFDCQAVFNDRNRNSPVVEAEPLTMLLLERGNYGSYTIEIQDSLKRKLAECDRVVLPELVRTTAHRPLREQIRMTDRQESRYPQDFHSFLQLGYVSSTEIEDYSERVRELAALELLARNQGGRLQIRFSSESE